MNVLTILRSVEELLYEVISWLLFYPLTLWRTLTRPLAMMRYSDQEQRDKPEKQYLEILSPPLFLVLSVVVAHGVELAVGVGVSGLRSPVGASIAANDQTLLAFRAVLFSTHAVAFAWVSLLLAGRKVDRETLRAPFFAQCCLSGTTTILVSLGGIAVAYPDETATLAGVAVIVAATIWYLIVQRAWLMRVAGVGGISAGVVAVATFAGSTAVVMTVGALLS